MPALPSPPRAQENRERAPRREDDELDELPPLDGDVRDAPAGDSGEGDGDDLDDPDGDASLDDATGEGDPTDHEEVDLDETDSGWLDEPADAASIDLGDPGTLDFGGGLGKERDEDSAIDGPEPVVSLEDLGLGLGPERGSLDAGDEGPVDPDEELRDADLPALDADDDGDVDDAVLIDASFTADEPHGLPWATPSVAPDGTAVGGPWERVGSPLPIVRATAVACSGRGAVAIGRQEAADVELWSIDLEGASQPLAARGLDLSSVVDLQGEGGAIRALLVRDRGALSTDGGLTFAAVDAGGPQSLPSPPREAAVPIVFGLRGANEAVAARKGGVLRRARSEGGAWTFHAWAGRVTALAFLDDAGRLVASTYSDVDDTTALVHLDVDGVASVVARVGAARDAPESDGQVISMALDEARGVVWVAGGFGLAAFAVR